MKDKRNFNQENTVVNPVNSEDSIDDSSDIKDPSIKDVPGKHVLEHNLKKLKSFKKIRASYKQNNMKVIFLNDLKTILDEYSPQDEDNKYNSELLVEILNISEEYFIYPRNRAEREDVKRKSVIQLMKPYFENNEFLLEKTIDNVWHKVNKSTYLKRLFSRLKKFILRK
jgi:hypothetical protein